MRVIGCFVNLSIVSTDIYLQSKIKNLSIMNRKNKHYSVELNGQRTVARWRSVNFESKGNIFDIREIFL